ncbi:MAG: tRNA lysidine(34) synthetase TilS, partial [Atopostipes sp.]|nr:tRNA lysidine(34) synthetase TilS [Atopostipes sp.]
MLEDIQGELKECTFLDSKNKVLLAVSGGVDSVVLLDLMNKIPSSKKPQIAIAHVNHHLRNESNSEEKFVKELAQKYSFPFYSHQWLKKDHPNSGIEKAARNERYNFFKTIMDEYKISYLMTGHHLDDQIETILMRLIRGASLEQLLGIKFKQSFSIKEKEGYLIRPLLNYSKKEIYEYAKSHQLNYIEDQSNKNKEYTRNRFR